jgi:high frequency lysogenization protein
MKEQTLTFAAICLAAHQVQQISRGQSINEENFSLLLNSLVEMSPNDTLAVYGGKLSNLKEALTLVIKHLGDSGDNKRKDPDFTRYVISLINLERRLTKQPKKMKLLAEQLAGSERQLQHYTIDSDTLIASFASIYSDIISPLGTRIQVSGEPSILKQTHNQHKIRALLLSGIRAAVLWRQVGGKRRTILFNRNKMVNTAKELLTEL